MEKYIFYQTQDHCWFVPQNKWAEYEYQEEVKPIRIVILKCSECYSRDLVDLLYTYPDTFENMIKSELEDVLTIYSN